LTHKGICVYVYRDTPSVLDIFDVVDFTVIS
jgi:hypothetical protein